MYKRSMLYRLIEHYTREFRNYNYYILLLLISSCEDFIKAEDFRKYTYKKLRV